MQYVTVRFVPDGTAMNAVEQGLADDPGVTREAMHHIRILEDDTGVLLCELSGEPDRAEAVFETHPDVIAHSVSQVGERVYAHVHQEFPGAVGELLAIPQRFELIVDTPIEYGPDGAFVVTVIGDQETLQESLEEIPENVEFDIVSSGAYRPGAERLFARLTERQQETVTVAQQLGYFDDPRGATYQDIADVLGCRRETVGEHLRKAQATLFAGIVPEQ